MKAILICPADRSSAAFLARTCPLALVPIFGRSLLDLWLTDLANSGAHKVLILAADRPEKVRAHSSFYAVQSSTSQNLHLLMRGFARLFNSH